MGGSLKIHDSFYMVGQLLYSVSQKIPSSDFLTFFPKRLRIFSPNFTCLLYVPIYDGLQIFIQLTAILTKLCHIKRDHHYMLKSQNVHYRPKHMLGGRT